MNRLINTTKVIFTTFCILFLCSTKNIFSQEKQAKKELINEYIIANDFRLVVYYHPIELNLTHKNSKHYINNKPTQNELKHAISKLPSYSIILINPDRLITANFNIEQDSINKSIIKIQEYESGRDYYYSDTLMGLTEHRFKDAQLLLDEEHKKDINEIALNAVLDKIEYIIEEKKLLQIKTSKLYLPSQQEIGNYIYEKTLEDKNNNTSLLEDYTRTEEGEKADYSEKFLEAIYNWASFAYQVGLDRPEDLLVIFQAAFPEIDYTLSIEKALLKGFKGL